MRVPIWSVVVIVALAASPAWPHASDGDPREVNGNPGCGDGSPADELCFDTDMADGDGDGQGDLPLGGVIAAGTGGEDPSQTGYLFLDGNHANEEYSGALAGYIGLNMQNQDGETGPFVGGFADDGREHFHRLGGGNKPLDPAELLNNLAPRM